MTSASSAAPPVALSLNALSRSQYEEAKLRFTWRFRCHVAALFVAVGAAYVPSVEAAYALSVVALLIEGGAWWLRFDGQQLKSLADDGRRRVLLVAGLGMSEQPLDVANLRLRFTRRAERRAPTFEREDYYASREEPGPKRLKECLQESAFWSAHLYREAARKELKPLVVFLLFAVIIFLGLPLASGGTALLIARGLVVVMAALAASDEVNRVLDWYSAAHQADLIDRRLDTVDTTGSEPILAAFADYQVVTACAPPISTGVYKAQSEHLNVLWKTRVDDTSQP